MNLAVKKGRITSYDPIENKKHSGIENINVLKLNIYSKLSIKKL
jgi:hypothetical protein